MLQAEVKINGNPIVLLLAHNVGEKLVGEKLGGVSIYDCAIYYMDPAYEPRRFTLTHDRDKGALALVSKMASRGAGLEHGMMSPVKRRGKTRSGA